MMRLMQGLDRAKATAALLLMAALLGTAPVLAADLPRDLVAADQMPPSPFVTSSPFVKQGMLDPSAVLIQPPVGLAEAPHSAPRLPVSIAALPPLQAGFFASSDAKPGDRRSVAAFAAASAIQATDPVVPGAVPRLPRPRNPRVIASALNIPAAFDPVARTQAPPGRVAAGAPVINSQTAPIELELGKGTLIRLRRPLSTVFVANPDTADVQVKSPTLIYVMAKAPGETVLYAVDDNEQVLLNAPLRVTHNLSRLRDALHSLVPNEAISVESVDGALVLSGNVSSAVRAEDARAMAAVFAAQVQHTALVNRLSVVAPNQVNLRVRIAEVDRNVLKEIGINWSSVLQSSRFAFGLVTANPVTIANNLAQNTATAAYSVGQSSIDAMIDALGQEGLITILAEPNLTALSGQTASFLAGGEFPIPVAEQPPSSSTGVTTITIEFKKYGVALEFTPTILDGSRINLRVRPEVSQLTSVGAVTLNGFSVPALTVRRAETSVELGSGESFAIAGLLENTTQQDISKIPGLGDIPVLGGLFRSDRFQHNESELVIIVTPFVVRPTDGPALATPTDGFRPPHDAQRVFLGRNYRASPAPGSPGPINSPGTQGSDSRGLIGSAGFSLD